MAKVAKRRGRYVLDFYDNHGKRHWKTLPAGTTLKAAKDTLHDIEKKIARGTYIPDNKIPMFKDVAQDWLKAKKVKVRDSHHRGLKGHCRNHFEEFDEYPVSRITTAMVEKWITKRQKDGMNITTLRKVIVTLNQIFKYCVRHSYMQLNPLDIAERPKSNRKRVAKRIKYFTPDEINRFLSEVKDLQHETLFKLAIFSGARQGESIKYIQTQMGHSKPTVTLDIYSHLIEYDGQEAAKWLEDTIFAKAAE